MARVLSSGRAPAVGRVAASGRFRDALTPWDIPGRVLHLRSDLGVILTSGAVTTWQDQSGLGNDGTQGGGASLCPTYPAGGANGFQVSFASANHQFLQFPNAFTGLTAAEIFLVYKRTSLTGASPDSGLWTFGTNVSGDIIPYTVDRETFDGFGSSARQNGPAGTWPTAVAFTGVTTLLNDSSIAGEWIERVNGKPIFSSASNTVAFSTACKIGQSAGSVWLNGVVDELVIYNRKLSAIERAHLVGDYFQPRYPITLLA